MVAHPVPMRAPGLRLHSAYRGPGRDTEIHVSELVNLVNLSLQIKEEAEN